MSEEKKSMFDGFETDEVTGEVIIPRATVGVAEEPVKDSVAEGDTFSSGAEYIPIEDELPKLNFDFEFGEEEFAVPEEVTDEDTILQSIDEALAEQMAVTLGPLEEEKKEETVPKKKGVWSRIPKWCRVTMISVASVAVLLCLLIGTKTGRSFVIGMLVGYVDDNIGREDDITPAPVTGEPNNEVPLPTQSVEDNEQPGSQGQLTVPTIEPRQEDYVYNILLIGIEALPQFGGERSDTMIIISVNSKDKKIYMTSLMRDMYVQIPGYSDNRLNSAYGSGGPQLLIDTIEQNFEVKIDGYVKVGFDSFEWIVDKLGGIEVTLTAEEAAYLNRTNYISKPEYRNVVAGTQLLNGNQVLGYCRVRYVPTANGTGSDFGRTERQRSMLTKLFNKYKDTGILKLVSILNDCLPQVVTNISKKDMQELLESVVENRILSLESYRLPVSGGFTEERIGGKDVLIVDKTKNKEALHTKIFGDVK